MKRPIQLLCLLPFLIALLLAPASDLQSKPTPDQAGAPAGMASTLADDFSSGGQKSSEFSAQAQQAQQRGDFQNAVLYWDRALRMDQDNPQLKQSLAEARRELAEQSAAQKALPVDSTQRDAVLARQYEAAQAAEKAGDQARARNAYRQIWLANPAFRDVAAKNAALQAPVMSSANAPTPQVAQAPTASVPLDVVAGKTTPAPPVKIEPLHDLAANPAPVMAQTSSAGSLSAPRTGDAYAAAAKAAVAGPGQQIAAANSPDGAPMAQLTVMMQDAEGKANQGQFAAARSLYEKALQKNPADTHAQAGLQDVNSKQLASLADQGAQPDPKSALKPAALAVPVAEKPVIASAAKPQANSDSLLDKADALKPATPSLLTRDATVDKLPPLQMASMLPAAAKAQGGSDAMKVLDKAKPGADQKLELASATLGVPATSAAATSAFTPAASATASLNIKDPKVKAQIKLLYDQGFAAYKQGDLRAARDKMNDILLVDAQNMQAKTFLDNTAQEWESRQADEKTLADAAGRDTAGNQKLSMPVSIETRKPTALGEFLNDLSFASGISFSVADGVQATVTAKFNDTPLKDVLDYVLLPNGLKWERNGDVIVVTTDLHTKTFTLTPQTLSSVQALMESNQLQKMIWPDGNPPLKGEEIKVDERSNLLMVTDSQTNINRVEGLLQGLHTDNAAVGLATSLYKIDPANGPKIKALLEAVLKTGKESPADLDRKIIVDGEDLIVYASQQDREKIEQLLNDKNFTIPFASRDLKIETFSLVPKEPLQGNPDLADAFFKNVQEQLKIFLYSKTGQIEAAKEGRKMWADPETMQITVTDYPDNLSAVGDFINSLDQIEQKQLFKVVYLKYVLAADMETQLQTYFGLEQPQQQGPTGPVYLVTKSLRVDQDYKWRDLELRIRQVNQNDVSNTRDDSVDILVRTGTRSEDITLQEYDSEFIDDYEIVAQDITPSGVPGEGRATIQIRYIPPPGETTPAGGTAAAGAPATPQLQQQANAAQTNPNLDIETFGDLNALIVRYRNPADLKQVQDLIDQLDKPIPQVSILTKMVEVDETRAKELSADWTMNNVQDLNLGSAVVNTRFAQDSDQFVSQFEPNVETPNSANLLKGVTAIDLITGGPSPLNLQLRALEAEGIITVVNGPRLTIKNGEQGTLTINDLEAQWNTAPVTNVLNGTNSTTGTGTGTAQTTNAQTTGQGSTGTNAATGNGNNNNNTTTNNGVMGQRVDLALTPQVTSSNSIEVEVDATLTDPVSNMGQILYVGNGPGNIFGSYAVTNSGQANQFEVNQQEKSIYTIATVKSGGTIVLGGWMNERQQMLSSGTPVLRNIPYIGKLLFSRNVDTLDRTNMLIFLNVQLVPID